MEIKNGLHMNATANGMEIPRFEPDTVHVHYSDTYLHTCQTSMTELLGENC